MSTELETLDQLLGGDLPLRVIRGLYPDAESFTNAIHAMLRAGDVQLLSEGKAEVPPWQWREFFVPGRGLPELSQFRLALTEQGMRRIV